MSGSEPGRVAIIGAAPCGLACARELAFLGHEDWAIYERNLFPGGHAASIVDPAGFTWDLGGHVVFSHFGEFDRLLEEVMGDDLNEHERSSFVYFDGRWVPYPFQNNLRYLDAADAYDCLVGLIDAPGGDGALDFAAWMERTFGAGIVRHFMRPYNLKVWSTPLEQMSATWIADRVSVVDHRRVLRSVLFGEDDVGWGPNNTFRFPRSGGTGAIYRRLAEQLGDHIHYGCELVELDVDRRRLIFANGNSEEYDILVSTMPLDRLVAAMAKCPRDVREATASLDYTGVWMVGVGCEQPLDDDRSWFYFPENRVPFYRVTNFAKYAAANVPAGDTRRYSSYLTETAYSRHRPVDGSKLGDGVVSGLKSVGLVRRETTVVSVHAVDIPYAYPVPTLARDAALGVVQSWLMGRDVLSRGRFGSWRYEIGNMDHASKMGIDIARFIVEGRPEELWTI
jgi:protoporphyrinogen oxidase